MSDDGVKDRDGARFVAFAELVGELVYERVPATGVFECSGAVERVTGWTAQELMQAGLAGWEEMVHPDDRVRVSSVLEATTTSAGGYHVEYRLRRKPGEFIDVEDRGGALGAAPGGDIRLVGSIRDLGDIPPWERSLRESLRWHRQMLESTKEPIAVAQDGRFAFVNSALLVLSGRSREELLAMPYLEFVHPADREMIAERHQRGLREPDQTRVVEPYEFRVLRPDGVVRWTEIRPRRIEWDGRRATLNFFTDITERVQTLERLKESENRYRSVFENTGTATVIVEDDTMISLANAEFARLTGFSKEELEGQKRLVEFFAPAERERVLEQPRLPRMDPSRGPKRCELRLIDRRGRVRHIELTMDAIPATRKSVASLLDLTDRRHAEEQLRQAQKLEAIGLLAGGVAHDFNNILTAINGTVELILDTMPASDPLRDDLSNVLQYGQRGASVTAQLLAFSRKQIIAPKVVDLNVIVAHASKMLRRLIGEDVELVFVPAEAIGAIKVDPGQLEQVLINLVVNARDAMPKGGRLVLETAGVAIDDTQRGTDNEPPPGRYVQLSVSDSGEGMRAEVKSRIFEPFFTTKPKGRGTGLGLSTIYGIVKQNAGFISVYSEVGVGTTFKIYFPRVDSSLTFEPAVAASALPRGDETVLLAEDEGVVRTLARRILTQQGYRVLPAVDGREAVEICRRHVGVIHLLLTDVVMPGNTGPALYESLKELRADLKVLYMSGYTENLIAHHGVLEPGVQFLPKPFTVEALVRKVREALDA